MDTIEAILVAILFFVPGFFIDKIKIRFFSKTEKEESDFYKTVYSIIYSVAVLFVNIFFITKILGYKNINTINLLEKELTNLKFLMIYISISIVSCILIAVLKHYILDSIILFVYNKIRIKKNLPIETKFSTVWDEIFENPEINMDDTYISIEKGGIMIAQGALASYSSPDFENKEVLLIHSNEFKNHLDNDKELKDKGKEMVFDKIDKEYYNFQTDVLIKFYNMQKFNEYAASYEE